MIHQLGEDDATDMHASLSKPAVERPPEIWNRPSGVQIDKSRGTIHPHHIVEVIGRLRGDSRTLGKRDYLLASQDIVLNGYKAEAESNAKLREAAKAANIVGKDAALKNSSTKEGSGEFLIEIIQAVVAVILFIEAPELSPPSAVTTREERPVSVNIDLAEDRLPA